MAVSDILASVDREIALLEQVRALLGGERLPKRKVGRPRKNAVAVVPVAAKPAKKVAKKKKSNLSAEGRKRIVEAVRRRWQAQRTAAAK